MASFTKSANLHPRFKPGRRLQFHSVHFGYMDNGLFRRHGSHGWAKRVLDRLEPTGFVVKVPEIVRHEGDEPAALAHLTHPHLLLTPVAALDREDVIV